MLDLLVAFNNTNLQGFPATQGVNSSGGQATDGTEFVANFINDWWGYAQALMEKTSQTPNGVIETFDNSQLFKAHQRFMIPGVVIPVAWNDDPLILGIRALFLSGQGVLRANYEDLDDIVYVGDADNATASSFYHADDVAGTIRNTTGAYLILPDLRGRVVRGLDLTGSVDPDGDSRDLGSGQDDAMQRITGSLGFSRKGSATIGGFEAFKGAIQAGINNTTNGVLFDNSANSSPYEIIFDSSLSVSPNPAKTDDTETRMINTALNYMITF